MSALSPILFLVVGMVSFWLCKTIWNHFRVQRTVSSKSHDPIEDQMALAGIILGIIGVGCLLGFFGLLGPILAGS